MKDKKLEEYLEEIGKAEVLSIDEELKLVKAVQAKGTDCDEMKRLEKADGRFVASIAKQYKHSLSISSLQTENQLVLIICKKGQNLRRCTI